MNDIRKTQALASWGNCSASLRFGWTQQYEALLHLADEFEDQDFISPQERARLIEKATALYARSIEGIGEGT